MASIANICNLAFSHFGHDANIVSIEPPDDSVEAHLCQQFYPMARDELLAEHPWTFATKRASLSALVSGREDFAYAYALPTDCVKTRKVLPEGYASDSESEVFELENGIVYTDVPSVATLVYTYRCVASGLYSPQFTASLSLLLASYLSGPVVKDTTGRLQALLMKRAQVAIGVAKASDANADTKRSRHESTADRVR